jgi:EAL domain-containing protein (putative c-di-GMP-specific phosphodiesterase class I)
MALGRPGSTSEQLLHQADAAMYEMKLDRRIASTGAPEGASGSAPRHEPTTHEVAVAVTQRAIVPHYQPVIDLRRDEEVGRQALARWTAPGQAPRPAADFMDVVEGTGVSLSLDLAILRDAAHDATTWSDALDLYVHVSSRFVMRPDAATFVEEILRLTGLQAGRLHLEIPGSAVGAGPHLAGSTLHELHTLGVRLVLDAPGLRAVPAAAVDDHLFDELRFRLPADPPDGPDPDVLGTVAQLPALGYPGLVAVGVESARQADALVEAGCDRVEGFRYGPALPSP